MLASSPCWEMQEAEPSSLHCIALHCVALHCVLLRCIAVGSVECSLGVTVDPGGTAGILHGIHPHCCCCSLLHSVAWMEHCVLSPYFYSLKPVNLGPHWSCIYLVYYCTLAVKEVSVLLTKSLQCQIHSGIVRKEFAKVKQQAGSGITSMNSGRNRAGVNFCTN